MPPSGGDWGLLEGSKFLKETRMNAMLSVDLDLVDVMPILPSLNLQETRRFYTQSLGFTEIELGCPDVLILVRGRIELHFNHCADPFLVNNSSVFLSCENVERLYEDFQRRGAEGLVRVTADGERPVSFHIRDPHGNILLFGRTRVSQMAA